MASFDEVWDKLITPALWSGIIRGIRFSSKELNERAKDIAEKLDEKSLDIIAKALNEIPEDIKSSKDNIKTYLKYKKSLDFLGQNNKNFPQK